LNYFVTRDNQQYGPYTLTELQRYVTQGNILLTDMARSEASGEWIPVQQIVGNINVPQSATPPGNGQASAYPGQGLSAPSAAEMQPVAALPPGLHWALVLLFGILTCGIFSTVWMFIQAGYIRKFRPESNAIVLYAIGISLLIFAGVFSGMDESRDVLAPLINIGGVVVLIVGHFSLKASIEEVFHIHLSGVMTFFFSVLYFQYHFHRIRNARITGAL
jgi:hypothetical protein